MKSRKEHKCQKAQYQLQSTLDDCGIKNLQSLKLLEVGFKKGTFLQACREAKIDAAGLEVEAGYYNRLHRQDPDLELILYDGNIVPLPDASFDIIVSYQVLEHVGSLETTLSECVRLLKPGGIMYHVFPNYHSFYEGHYNVLWWPFLNQKSGRGYLKLLRKYTPYYETLNIVKPKTVRRIMVAHEEHIEVLSLGKNEFEKRFTPEQIAKVNQRLLRGLLKSIHAVPPVRWVVLKLMGTCGIYYPITLIARKKS
ncbi:MAG: class I SAM-dependent methyltransferase [Planctomycetota bacterium]|jgi:SAM-dependent methyltransferase